jgi:hypothetical protein
MLLFYVALYVFYLVSNYSVGGEKMVI